MKIMTYIFDRFLWSCLNQNYKLLQEGSTPDIYALALSLIFMTNEIAQVLLSKRMRKIDFRDKSRVTQFKNC